MKINLGKHFENTEVTEEQLKEINGLLGIEKKDKYFIPTNNEEYWYKGELGGVGHGVWQDWRKYDSKLFRNKRVFKTKKEAYFERDKQQFLLQMERDFLDNSDELDWKDNRQTKYHMVCNRDNDNVMIYFNSYLQSQGVFYTTNREWLVEYAKENEENIKKYVFGVIEND